MAVFTLENKQIVWMDKSSGIGPSDVNLCRTVVDLFVSMGKSSGKNRPSRLPNQTICLLKNLFVPFSHKTNNDDLFV